MRFASYDRNNIYIRQVLTPEESDRGNWKAQTANSSNCSISSPTKSAKTNAPLASLMDVLGGLLEKYEDEAGNMRMDASAASSMPRHSCETVLETAVRSTHPAEIREDDECEVSSSLTTV